MNARQQAQQHFDQSDAPLIVGDVSHCPLPPEQLATLNADSPYVVEVIGSGLTAEVFHLRVNGRDYNLKKRRQTAKVANLDGQYSFLNEVQRRRDFEALKANPATAPHFAHIVPTLYADYRLGILLSPWIDGQHIQTLTPDLMEQLLVTLEACEAHGLMEWDLCSGNMLVDSDNQLWLFDFGYMFPFDPLREFNSNGTQDPIFHAVERFETRFFFGWLLSSALTETQQLTLFRQLKQRAVASYQRKVHWLHTQQATSQVLAHYRQIIARWQTALSSEHAFVHLFQLEAFRSHVLDIEDDLHGQSCTPLTLKRIDYVLDVIANDYPNIAQHGGLFYANHSKSAMQLTNDYQRKRELAQQYQIR
ncbi:phosphotransferase [Vibrio fluvialis]